MKTVGKRGPAPTPTRLRMLRGLRVDTDEPIPSEAPIEAPSYIDDEAREVWDRVVPDLVKQGVVTAWDTDALGVFVTAVTHHRRAVAYVNQSAVLLSQSRKDRGEVVKHPAMQVVRDQAAIVRAYAQEFGLTPSSRSQLGSPIAHRTTSRPPAARLLTTTTDGDDR
ncbi:MAG: phage terminase small subunit P27 family [Actinomycetota bacterium]